MNISVCLILAILLSVAQGVWAGEVNSIVSFEGWVTDDSSQPIQGVKVVLIGRPFSGDSIKTPEIRFPRPSFRISSLMVHNLLPRLMMRMVSFRL